MDNFKCQLDEELAYKNVQRFVMPQGFVEFNKMFEDINEN